MADGARGGRRTSPVPRSGRPSRSTSSRVRVPAVEPHVAPALRDPAELVVVGGRAPQARRGRRRSAAGGRAGRPRRGRTSRLRGVGQPRGAGRRGAATRGVHTSGPAAPSSPRAGRGGAQRQPRLAAVRGPPATARAARRRSPLRPGPAGGQRPPGLCACRVLQRASTHSAGQPGQVAEVLRGCATHATTPVRSHASSSRTGAASSRCSYMAGLGVRSGKTRPSVQNAPSCRGRHRSRRRRPSEARTGDTVGEGPAPARRAVACRSYAGAAVVAELPDEPALEARRGLDGLPSGRRGCRCCCPSRGSTRTGSAVWSASPTSGVRDDLVELGVHRADDVGGRRARRCPVASWSRPRTAAAGSGRRRGPIRGGVVVGAVVALVAERPDDDAGVVLVATHHPRHPVDERCQ